MSDDKTYSIGELADQAQVTTRTIRYYVTEGLLPTPDKEGRVAEYGPEHLARLQLIKILKDEFLPLQEIGALLEALRYQEVLDLLDQKRQQDTPPPDTAKAYLQTLLQPAPAPQPMMRHRLQAYKQTTDEPPSSIREAAQPPAQAPPGAAGASSVESEATPITRWQRIPLTPEVELHVKEGLEKKPVWKKVEQLIKIAGQLLRSMLL
jgi:DNA-binding transcriptional MerR regulator